MTPPETPLLSSSQRRLVAFTLGFAALAGAMLLTVLTLVVLAKLVGFFSLVLWPPAVAGIFALILRPAVAVLQRRLRLSRLSAVIVLYGVVVLAVAGALVAIVPPTISQLADLVTYLPVLWHKLLAWGEGHFPEWVAFVRQHMESPTWRGVMNTLAEQAQIWASKLAASLWHAGTGLLGVFGFLASLAVAPVYLFFFLLSRDKNPADGLEKHLPFLKPGLRADALFLVREFMSIVVAFFRGQLLIGFIMGALLALGFTLSGLRFGLALGLVIGFLNIIPYLGSIVGLTVVLPLAFFQNGGSLALVGLVLGVFLAVQLLEGWVLTPRIMGRQTGLHPVAIIFAVFFWGQALGGVIGMLLAVPLTAFFVTAWRLVRRKYFDQTVTDAKQEDGAA